MADKKPESKRLNRAVGLSEVLGSAIDPVFRKRGFASRDIVTNWASIAPTPYDKVAIPDKLHWPRGVAGAEGAILFIRCADSHRLALAHESGTIAAAINRYFGYVLVGAVKLSVEPFRPGSGKKTEADAVPTAEVRARVADAVANVEDEGIREALSRLGLGLLNNRK